MARWLRLTCEVLPGLAASRGWPVSADHCFMRICLDAACGRPWFEAVARPAIRHIDDATLARAVAIAEGFADGSVPLEPANRRSIADRAAARGAPARR